MNNMVPPSDTVVHEISVDFVTRPIIQPIHLIQFDDKLAYIKVNLYRNGKPYVITSGMKVKIRIGKSDGTFVYNVADGTDNSKTAVYFKVTKQMTVLAEQISATVELSRNDEVVASAIFKLNVEKNPIQPGDVESMVEYQEMDEILTKVGAYEAIITKNVKEFDILVQKAGKEKQEINESVEESKNVLKDLKGDVNNAIKEQTGLADKISNAELADKNLQSTILKAKTEEQTILNGVDIVKTAMTKTTEQAETCVRISNAVSEKSEKITTQVKEVIQTKEHIDHTMEEFKEVKKSVSETTQKVFEIDKELDEKIKTIGEPVQEAREYAENAKQYSEIAESAKLEVKESISEVIDGIKKQEYPPRIKYTDKKSCDDIMEEKSYMINPNVTANAPNNNHGRLETIKLGDELTWAQIWYDVNNGSIMFRFRIRNQWSVWEGLGTSEIKEELESLTSGSNPIIKKSDLEKLKIGEKGDGLDKDTIWGNLSSIRQEISTNDLRMKGIRRIASGVKTCKFNNQKTITFLTKNEMAKIFGISENSFDAKKVSVSINVLTNKTSGYLRTPYMYPDSQSIAVSSTENEPNDFDVAYTLILTE